MLVGGLEVSPEDAERLKQLVKDRAKATAYEIKQKAWELANEGFKTDFNKDWCRKFIDAFPNDMAEELAYLLEDLTDLYIAHEKKKYTLEECKAKAEDSIQLFITRVYAKEIGNGGSKAIKRYCCEVKT